VTKPNNSTADPTVTPHEFARAREIVFRFLALAGIEDPKLIAEAELSLTTQVAEINQLGLREPDLAVIGQAYIRAIGRVGAAEDEAISRLRDISRIAGATEMTAFTERLRVLGRDVFDVLHSSHLSRLIAGDPQSVDRSRRSQQPTAVAHVDVIASTELLQRATQTETERLVDGLFRSAQAAIRGRGVEATKYVGDGVFLVGPDPTEVAAASLDCMARLGRDAGLKARGGLAFGPVVHRAGDVFGLPVNISHVLTKSATAGALLAAAVGDARLPVNMCGSPREVSVAGLDAPLRVFEMTGEIGR
jgi:class 3 adenylate cyclase